MWKSLFCSLLLGIGLAAVAADRTPDDQPAAPLRSGEDRFVAGGSVTVREPVAGDLIVSGGSVDVDAAVAGDAVALGGKLRLGAEVGQTVYAAGGQITINGRVARNVRVAGGQVELGPKSEVLGNVSAAGGQVRIYGTVKGQLQAAAGRVLIDGVVGGDVTANSGQLELGPNARIAGKLRYRSSEAPLQDPAAQVAGGIERLPGPPPRADGHGQADREEARHRGFGVMGGVWTLGLIVLGSALLAALPGFSASVARTMRERPGMSVLLGFVLLVCAPVAALILLVTLIGIPLGLFTLALYLALLPLAYVSAGIGLGDWALQRWRPAGASRLSMRIGATAAALVALSLLGGVPVLGALAGFVALLAGLGALLLHTGRAAAHAAA